MGIADSPVMSDPATVVVDAHAKVNLFLRVLGPRPDGFHDIETLVAPISLADRVGIHAVADAAEFRTLSLSLDVTGDADLIRGVPADESNLAMRAAAVLADRIHPYGFADIRVEKRIPHSAGLGGGSADAAAVLQALAALWGADLPSEELRALAAQIGSDVPALVSGGSVLVSGRGERVEAVSVAPLRLALVTFGFGVRTADAYRWWDEDGGTSGPDPSPVVDAARDGDREALAATLFNDLEESVMKRHPAIRGACEGLLAAGVGAVVMCGSGPSVAAVLPDGIESLDPETERELDQTAGCGVTYVETI
jgi:4-diphosphocytidyl-2-C-methyl-D-erythritol kinase